MNRCKIVPGLLCLALVLLFVIPAQAFPPSGYDFISTSASINFYDPLDSNVLLEAVFMTGDAVIWRGDEYDPGDGRMIVDTRLDTLLLSGYSVVHADSIYATLNRSMPAATGQIQQVIAGQDFPAESYFDVYYLITIGPPAPNPPSPAGSVQGKLKYDLQSGVGRAMLAAGQPATDIEEAKKAPYTGPANQEDANAARQGGEDVTSPTVIGGLPYFDVGVTTGYADDYDEACPSTSTSPDVVYSFVPPTDTFIIIDLCGAETDYDTKVFVYETAVGNLVACNDDACSNQQTPWASRIECFPVTGGTRYYIIIDGWDGDFGMYELLVTYCDGGPCVVCPAGASYEDEPCTPDEGVDSQNGGCNSTPPVFTPIQCGETVCGQTNTFLFQGASYRDTDWYRLVLTQSVDLTWSVISNFDLLIFMLAANSEDCADYGILGNVAADPCATASLTATVAPGVYWLLVMPSVFTGLPCADGPWDYVATVTCTPDQVVWINPDSVHMLDTIYQIPPHGRVYKDPRKTPIIDPATGDTVGWLRHEHIVDPPPSGSDTIPTHGWMDVWVGPDQPSPTQPPDEVVEVDGTTILSWGEPRKDDGGISTEILSMDLTGESDLFGPVILSLPQPAPGQSWSTGPEFWPLSCYFDVPYQIIFPAIEQIIQPLQPPVMQSEGPVNSFPPVDLTLIDPNPHPVHDVQNPGVIIGWVRPIHWLPPPPPAPQDSTGACCDRSNGSCRITTQADCNPVHEIYLGDGISCNPNPCEIPPPDHDCFQSAGQGTITLDTSDTQCLNGIQIALSSALSPATQIEFDPPPYHNGQTIQTEMVQMELSAVDPNLGLVIIRERSDRASTGAIENTVTDGQGNFVQGDSYFDLYLEVELPDLGLLLNTGESTLRMEATIYSLPPDSGYFPPPAASPLALYDAVTGQFMGWLCHAEHLPGIEIPCDEPRGACCDAASGNCAIIPAAQCVGGTLVYQGDNTSCVPNPCVDTCTTGWTAGLDTILFSTFNIDVYNPADSTDYWGSMVAYGAVMIVQRGAPYQVSPGIWRMDTEILQLSGVGNSAIFGPFTLGLDPNQPSTGFIEMCDSCDDTKARSEFTVNYQMTTTLGPPMHLLTGSSLMELPCSANWDPSTPPNGHEYNDPRKVPIYDASGQLIGYTIKRHAVNDEPPCTHWTPGVDTILFSTFSIDVYNPADSTDYWGTIVAYGTQMIVQRGAPYEASPNIWRMDTEILALSGAGNSPLMGGPFTISIDPTLPSGGFIEQCDSCDDSWARSEFTVNYLINTSLPPPENMLSGSSLMELPCDVGWNPGEPFTPPNGHTYNDPRKVPIYDANGQIIGYTVKRHSVNDEPPCTHWTPGLDTILFSTFSIDVYNPADSTDFWGTLVAYGTQMIVQRGAPFESSPNIWRMNTTILQLSGAGNSALFGPFTIGLDPNQPSVGFIEQCDSCDDTWARSEFTVNYVITTTLAPPQNMMTGSSLMELPCEAQWNPGEPFGPPNGHEYNDPRKVPIYDASGQIIGYTMKRHAVSDEPPCTHWTPGLDTIVFSTFEIEFYLASDTVNPADTLVAYGANMVVQRGAPFEETANIWRMNTTVLEFSGSGWSPILGAFQIALDPSATSIGFIRQCDSCDDNWAESELNIIYVITTNLPPPMDTVQSDTAKMVLPCDPGWDPGDPFEPPNGGSYVDPRKVPIYDADGNIIGYIWKRHHVAGTPNPDVGACCIGPFCVITDPATCELAGGIYQGPGTTCTPNPCGPAIGACCDPLTGNCQQLPQVQCEQAGGFYIGDGVPCTPDPCGPDIPGACCFPSGGCEELLQAECEQNGGDYKGDGVPCSPDICLTCCNHDGIRGDIDYSFGIDVADLTYIVDYLFRGGPPPPCFEEGNVNGIGGIDVSDLGYIVDYLFREGPPPPPCPVK